ncbi:MAG TPA: cation:proton antiporter [Pyrinomonadaceae bacterium]
MSSYTQHPAKSFIYYFGLLIIFSLGIWLILTTGSRLSRTHTTIAQTIVAEAQHAVTAPPKPSERSPVSVLLMQVVLIIAAAKIVAALFSRIGQPPVMGEMVAGIALGPSLLGWLFPQASAFLFPASSMTTLGVLSQIGVVLFMFVVGAELDLQHLKEKASSAIMVSHASIIVPFLLGSALAISLYSSLAPDNTAFMPFALFMGVAMSITAFPVLARILKDRNLSHSPLGNTALACASIDDVTAWCILALVIAIVKSTGVMQAITTFWLTVLFIGAMLFLIKPRVQKLIERRVESQSRMALSGVLAFALVSAWITETIGIHALFGGFLAGVVMPSTPRVQTFLRERIENFSTSLLIPLFFVFTGLRTQITLLNDLKSWLICLAIIAVAIVGKLVGSMLMARWMKMSWHDSFAIGVLMNTRGLVELVVLNIGYDLGILSGRIFAMMVIMALTTTFMTTPLLSLIKVGET